jgi:hypothetical protein
MPMASIAAAPLDDPNADVPASIGAPAAPRPPALRPDANRSSVDADLESRASFQEVVPPTASTAIPPRMVDIVVDVGRASPSPAESPAERPGRSGAPLTPGTGDREDATRVPPLLIRPELSDRAPVPGAVARKLMPPVSGAAQNAARAEPGEVHIHIGRVEVTAVHEAPVPRRRPPAAPSPTSLDVYLAGRRRG